MPALYKGSIPIIDESNWKHEFEPIIDGQKVMKGMVPRDYTLYPEEMFAQPDTMKLFEETDWDGIYEEQEATKSSLEHLYLGPDGKSPRFVNLDQGQNGYCWAYSSGHASMFLRLIANQPIIRLWPTAVAAIIKNGANEGGWCGLSAKWIRENGIPTEEFWPNQQRSLSYDTAAMRANAKLHLVTEDYVDLTKQVYDQNLTTKQLATCLFSNQPCPTDYAWWSHSVCAIRWVRIERGSWGPMIINSWKGWGRYGLAVLQGNQGKPMGAVCQRVTGAAAA